MKRKEMNVEENFLPMNLQFFAEPVEPEDVEPEDVEPEDVEPEDDEPEDVEPEDDKKNKSGKKSGVLNLSQKKLSAMMAREKNQGRKSVYNDLGLDPENPDDVEKVKAIMVVLGKTEEIEEVDEGLLKANERALNAEIKTELYLANVNKKYIDDVLALVKSNMLADENKTVSDILKSMQKRQPFYFEEVEGAVGTGAAISTRKKSNGGKEKSIAQKLAERKVGQTKKESMWK
jgi:hypothetical protein